MFATCHARFSPVTGSAGSASFGAIAAHLGVRNALLWTGTEQSQPHAWHYSTASGSDCQSRYVEWSRPRYKHSDYGALTPTDGIISDIVC